MKPSFASSVNGLVDRAMDAAIVPGFTSIGYALRRRSWEPAPDLSGRSFLVTGGSSGLGEATCELLAEAGGTVHMVVRDVEKGERVRAGIAERTGAGELHVWRCDVADNASVREFAESFTADVPELAALVNNAGVMPPERTLSPDGIELSFATNVTGPFLLANLLEPVLRAGAPSRVVNVSSGGMYGAKLDGGDLQLEDRDYDPVRFYAHTKRCEVVLTELFQERAALSGITYHAVHPGWADTPGVSDSLPGFRKVMGPLLRDARQGADTAAWACWGREPLTDPGRFWHDRKARPTHKLPNTKETPEARLALWAECQRLTEETA